MEYQTTISSNGSLIIPLGLFSDIDFHPGEMVKINFSLEKQKKKASKTKIFEDWWKANPKKSQINITTDKILQIREKSFEKFLTVTRKCTKNALRMTDDQAMKQAMLND